MRGYVRWSVLDEHGMPEIPRSPSGMPLAPVEGVRQSNLITDVGMDAVGSVGSIFNVNLLTQGNVNSRSLRRVLAVGTGSVAPAVTDTTLDSEVQSAAADLGFGSVGNQFSLDLATNEYVNRHQVTRVVQMNADRNLTEFGFRYDDAGNVFIRELFRDGVGTPITVSLLNGKYIRVDHTWEVRLPAPAAGTTTTINLEQYDAANVLTSTTPYNVTYGLMGDFVSSSSPFSVWSPINPNLGVLRITQSDYTFDRDGAEPSFANFLVTVGLGTYVPGVYTREKFKIFTAPTANGLWYGYAIRDSGFVGNHWLAVFTSPVSYEKVSTDTLREGVLSSWARA